MKKLSLFLLCLMMMFSSVKVINANGEYYAKSYIVIEKESKLILEGNNYYNIQSVASISKLMTFYVAYKYMDLDNMIIVGDEIKSIIGSAVYLEENEVIYLMPGQLLVRKK